MGNKSLGGQSNLHIGQKLWPTENVQYSKLLMLHNNVCENTYRNLVLSLDKTQEFDLIPVDILQFSFANNKGLVDYRV